MCLLNKAIYGLKQGARKWNDKLVKFLKEWGFVKSNADPCALTEPKKELYLATHADDGHLLGKNESVMNALLSDLNKEFRITFSHAEFCWSPDRQG